MTFEELRAVLVEAASRGDGGIASVDVENPGALRVAVATAPGRSHAVYLLLERETGGDTVRLIAPAIRIPKGKELTLPAATALLRRNASLSAGALALLSVEGDDYIALVVPMPLERAEPAEALLSVIRSANGADGFEESVGGSDLL